MRVGEKGATGATAVGAVPGRVDGPVAGFTAAHPR